MMDDYDRLTELDLATAQYWNATTLQEQDKARRRLLLANVPPVFSRRAADLPEPQMDETAKLAPEDEPFGVEIKMADGIFIKQICLNKASSVIKQHAHSYDHTSMLALGRVAVWANGKMLGIYTAPSGIFIKAHIPHKIMSLVDGTMLYCIHRIDRTGVVEIDD